MLRLLMGCNNGGEDPQKVFLKSVVSLGSNFLDVFTSFGEMASGVLGFNAETKKSAVGDYFKQVKETVEGAKSKFNTMVADMKEKGNPNYSATESEVSKFIKEKLDKIIEGAKKASEAIGDAGDPIGNVADQNAGAEGTDVEKLANGIKDIVGVVLKEGKHDVGTDKKASDLSARTANGEGEAGKLFAANAGNAGNGNAKKAAAYAVKAVGSVTGADILKAMIQNGIDPAAKNAKDGIISGAIALRAMAKGGKFAGPSDQKNEDYIAEVKGVAVSSVTKALNTLTVAIRKTIDEGLKSVKEAMKINPETTPVISEAGNVTR